MSKGNNETFTIIRTCKSAIGKVRCVDIGKMGSGFFINGQGYFVTNNHVVSKMNIDEKGAIRVDYSKQMFIKINDKVYPATLLSDENADRPIVYDYAILKVRINSNAFLEAAEVSKIAQGEKVIALGYPLDFDELIATNGIISATISRPSHINSLHRIKTFLTDTLVTYGNSGGPLIRASDGKVIGIITMLHEIRDEVRERLIKYINLPKVEINPPIRDLIEFALRYINIGLSHAISIEYVMADPVFKSNKSGD